MLSTTTRLGLGLRPSMKPVSLIKPINTVLTRNFIKTIPQPPGHIVGTVNDAYIPPPPHKTHGSYHWTSERIVTVAMAPLIITPFLTGSTYAIADSIMGSLLLYHSFAGFQSCIIDYIPLRVYGVWHKAAMGLLTFGSLIAAYGIYEIENKEEEGLVGIVKKIWTA